MLYIMAKAIDISRCSESFIQKCVKFHQNAVNSVNKCARTSHVHSSFITGISIFTCTILPDNQYTAPMYVETRLINDDTLRSILNLMKCPYTEVKSKLDSCMTVINNNRAKFHKS